MWPRSSDGGSCEGGGVESERRLGSAARTVGFRPTCRRFHADAAKRKAAVSLTQPDTSLSVEEQRKIRSLHVGGFGPLDLMRAYHHALDRILPRVTFALNDLRDPRSRPGRPSAAAHHRKRHTRCSLYRHVAFAAVETLNQLKADDRNARRRQRRAVQTAIHAARRAGDHENASALADQAARRADQQKRDDEQRRKYFKFTLDALTLNLQTLLDRHTRLRGERRQQKIGEILAALNLASPEPSAVRQRLRRLPPDMKAVAAKRKPTPTPV